MALPDFPSGIPADLQTSRSTRLLGAPAFLVLRNRARDPRSQYLTIAWWDQATLCDST
jgi:hypothetical protein